MLSLVSTVVLISLERLDLPKRNAQSTDGLSLEAVALGRTSPVPHTAASPLLHVLSSRSDESISVCGIGFVARVADGVAVEVAHGLAECDGADDECNEEQRVDGCHYQQTEVGEGPVVADGDHDVEGCNAGLKLLAVVQEVEEQKRTTLSVPTNSLGGSAPTTTIICTKLLQMPMTMTMQRAWRMRTRRNILLRGMAP